MYIESESDRNSESGRKTEKNKKGRVTEEEIRKRKGK